MSVPARLLSVRLQGFKSFASRTMVEFGSGISAIVGPNGAGKSNLADALRWALGEQGRALRTRRSEDIIFAGSEAKPALGMADVTLVIENADGLLPVEYSVVELGRRLFRSGENDYLLNGTRVRLRDLEDLLDAARLADNAFLFIGQGMVDQALALRPEERRPLFTEVAGVRRYERRKRAAEEHLAEAESNLARVRDIVAELRPQARRLAAQAEQQLARAAAADALGRAVVAAGRQRWHAAAVSLASAHESRQLAQTEMDGVISELRAADDEVGELSAGLDRQQADLGEARAALDEARAAFLDARVADARLDAEREAFARERARLEADRESTAERVAAARRRLALPPSQPPPTRPLGKAPGHLLQPPPGSRVDAAVREEELANERAGRMEDEARVAHDEAVAALAAATEAAQSAAHAAEAARQAVAALVGERRAADDRAASSQRAATRLVSALEVLDERLNDSPKSMPTGGSPLAAGLQLEGHLRRAVEAALGAAVRGAVVEIDTAGDVAPGSVPLIVRDLPAHSPEAGEGAVTVAGALAAGGGRLAEALLSDPSGAVRRLLERAVWVPEIGAALRLAAALQPGWIVATVRGDALDSRGVLLPAPTASIIEVRAERSRVAAELESAEEVARDAEERLSDLDTHLVRAEVAAAEAGRGSIEREAERRGKVEAEALAGRRHELAVREAAWARAHLVRVRTEAARRSGKQDSAPATHGDAEDETALAAHRRAVEERQRLEGSLAADLERSEAIARELERLAAAEATTRAEAERQRSLLAELAARVAEREKILLERDLDGAAVRERLQAAERAGRAARERLRLAESRARAAEVDELETRMALDAVREQLLVELAGLGNAGLRVLGAAHDGSASGAGDEAAATALEAALDAVTPGWVASSPGEAPTSAKLASLRRRFHELGAVNPFAPEEHAEIQARLSSLEAQRDDLERAISATRRLIGDLERLISEQFQTTFRAMESAFGRRFTQLFGGGYARLALTEPDDPAASGVEIIARPPGKKAQSLSMLSGGERALTAVALLFAMLEVRPVPFCVLDEVDAALDEANIGRFVAALRELAASIQFVVITHNRGTIEEADALYGVTIGDDAVSRVVSLRLDGRTGGPASRSEVTLGAAHRGAQVDGPAMLPVEPRS